MGHQQLNDATSRDILSYLACFKDFCERKRPHPSRTPALAYFIPLTCYPVTAMLPFSLANNLFIAMFKFQRSWMTSTSFFLATVLCLLVLRQASAEVESFGSLNADCSRGQASCLVILHANGEESHRCYDPTTHVCNHHLLCAKEKPLRCGDKCYSSGQYVCINNTKLCPAVFPEMCGIMCYSPQHHMCKEGVLIART